MKLSIHYYVLSLSDQTSRLYEGFRDKLIDIQDTNFPFENSIDTDNQSSKDTQLKEFFNLTDQRFSRYCEQDPHRLVVIGKKRNLSIYKALKTHQDILIDTVEGDYYATSPHDLGKIVWPVVKQAISGANRTAISDLETAAKVKKVVSGIDSVSRSVESETGSTLFVEEDYHVKGSIHISDQSVIFSKHVDLWEVIDDVVDVIIEKVLKMGGNVIFLNSGSLIKLDRIALILRG